MRMTSSRLGGRTPDGPTVRAPGVGFPWRTATATSTGPPMTSDRLHRPQGEQSTPREGDPMTNLTGADVQVRRARGEDAADIAAVFDAAVSTGWAFLGELAQKSMFSAEHWDRLVAEHTPPDALLLADDPADGVVGFTAVHVEEGELYLLFVHPDHAGRGLGRRLLEAAHDLMRAAGRGSSFLFTEERMREPGRSTRRPDTGRTERCEGRSSKARRCESCDSSRTSTLDQT